MKFTALVLLTLMLAALFTPLCRAEDGVSENAAILYAYTIPSSGRYVIASLGHEAFGGGALTLREIFGTNQLRSSNVKTLVDRVMFYDPVGVPTPGYRTYAQKANGEFYNTEDWSGLPNTNRFPAGVGFWLSQPTSATNNKTVLLAGQVVSVPSAAKTMITGMQMIGPLFSGALTLTNNNWLADGARASNVKTLCDRIMIFDGVAYSELGLRADGSWRYISNPDQWTTGPAVVTPLNVGQGAWYRAQTNFIWSEAKPYIYP